MIGRLTGTLLAAVSVILFWWLVSERLSIPAWQVGAIPAAVAGGLVGTFDRRESRWRMILLLLMAGFSTLLGSWYPVHAGLLASQADARPTTDQLLMEAITRMEEENTDLAPSEERSASMGIPWRMSLQVAGEQIRRSPWLLLGHGLIAGIITLQAARMASLSTRRRNVE